MLYTCDVIPLMGDAHIKLYYDKHLQTPTYYAQQGIRNGKKATTMYSHTTLKSLLKSREPLLYKGSRLYGK